LKLPTNTNPVDEWVLARFIGYLGGAVAFWLFTRRRESRNAAPYHSLRSGVVGHPVTLPARSGLPRDQDTYAPHGAAPGEEKVNGRG
jgi:hypothetical protein